MTTGTRLSHSFLIRLWFDRGEGEWRGHITHIQTGRRRAFRKSAELLAAIAEVTPRLGGDEPPGPATPISKP
jgi:hypothetical protein